MYANDEREIKLTFANADFLPLLAFVPLLLLLSWLTAMRRRRALHQLGDAALVFGLLNRNRALWRALRGVLWFAGFVLVIVALLRPTWGQAEQTETVRGVSIVIVLDISTSMEATDLSPNRLERARLTIRDLLANLESSNEVALVLFAGAPFLYLPLTTDIGTAQLFLDRVTTGMVPTAGTAIANALRLALGAFPEDQGEAGRVVFLLTDGENHTGEPIAAAQSLRDAGVVLHVFGYGTPEGANIPDNRAAGGVKLDLEGEPVVSRLNEVILQQIADTAEGTYRRAGLGGREAAIMRDLITQVATRPIGELTAQRGLEQYAWFALAGFVCLLAVWLIPEGRRK